MLERFPQSWSFFQPNRVQRSPGGQFAAFHHPARGTLSLLLPEGRRGSKQGQGNRGIKQPTAKQRTQKLLRSILTLAPPLFAASRHEANTIRIQDCPCVPSLGDSGPGRRRATFGSISAPSARSLCNTAQVGCQARLITESLLLLLMRPLG